MSWYSDHELWLILGFGAVIFVAPAVSILLARDLIRKYRRERTKDQQRHGFHVLPAVKEPPAPDPDSANRRQ